MSVRIPIPARRLAAGVLTAGGLAVAAASAPAVASVAGPAPAGTGVHPLSTRLTGPPYPKPPTIRQCEATRNGRACYGPAQLQAAYHMGPLYRQGLTGKGKTIVIVDAFGSPTAKADLQRFDRDFGLPDPPSFRVITPAGPIHRDINSAEQGGWASETSIDIEYSHAMAPGADILLVETPVAETEGLVGIPQIVKAENYVIDHRLGDVISQSFGATEETFPSAQALRGQRSAFINAARHGVAVLASSGDAGPTNPKWNGNTYPKRVNSWPSSDPLVTSVGGTELHLTAAGTRTSPDTAWNQTSYYHAAVGGGGGYSAVFGRPSYQDSVRSVVGSRRGTPDISLDASTASAVIVYQGFTSKGDDDQPGYYAWGGTSVASPVFAGIVAVAEQAAGRDLGPLNPALYDLGSGAPGIPDVTHGNTNTRFTQHGRHFVVKGFRAVRGYDLATGLGTVDGTRLIAELSR